MMLKLSTFLPKRRWLRWFTICSLLLVLLFLFSLLTLPFVSKRYLSYWLLENGADVVTVEKIRLNPFTGRLTLEGVDIRKKEKSVISNSTLFFDISLRSLFNKEALVEKAVLKDFIIDIERFEDNSLLIGSYPVPAGEAPALEEEVETDLQWIFSAQDIALENVKLTYRQPEFMIELVIDSATMDTFSTGVNESSSSVALTGTLNNAPISLELSAFDINPAFHIQGKLQFRDFTLEDLAPLLADHFRPFSGVAGASGSFSVMIEEDSNLKTFFDGTAALDKVDLAGSGWATDGTLLWNGEITANRYENAEIAINLDGSLNGTSLSFAMEQLSLEVFEPEISIDGKTGITITDMIQVESEATLSREKSSLNLAGKSVLMDKSSWTGTILYNSGNMSAPMQVVTNGTMALANTTYSQPELVILKLNKVEVAGKTEVTLSDSLMAIYNGDIDLSGTSVDLDSFSAGSDSLSWKGGLTYQTQENEAQDVRLSGNLSVLQTDVQLLDARMHLAQEKITLATEAGLFFDNSWRYSGTSTLESGGFSLVRDNAPMLTIAAISAGNLTTSDQGTLFLESFSADEIFLTPSHDQPLELAIASVNLSGISSPDLQALTISTLEIQKPVATETSTSRILASLENIGLSEIEIDEHYRISARSIQARDGSFLSAPANGNNAPVTLASIDVSPVSWSSEDGTYIGKIIFTDLYGAYDKGRQDTAQSEPVAEQNTHEKDENPHPIPLKISEIELVGNSEFRFQDQSLNEPFDLLVIADTLSIANIDLSDPGATTTYTFKGTVDKYARLDISGTIMPAADPLVLKQQTHLRNYALPQVSAYVAEAIGTIFTDGQLDLVSELAITGQVIDSDNELALKGLKVQAVDEELARDLNTKLPVPLDLALTMLRDSDGNINLSVPISGELTSLQYGLVDVISTALTKAISTGLTPYLAYTFLGPTGALAYLGVKLGSQLLDTSFPLLTYSPNISTLTEEQQTTLNIAGEAMAKTLESDSEKSYSICPKVIPGEIKTDDFSRLSEEGKGQALYALGETRATVVKNYLIEKFGISEDQLLICNPGLDFESGASGTIEFKE